MGRCPPLQTGVRADRDAFAAPKTEACLYWRRTELVAMLESVLGKSFLERTF
jgi:hypothetical protein